MPCSDFRSPCTVNFLLHGKQSCDIFDTKLSRNCNISGPLLLALLVACDGHAATKMRMVDGRPVVQGVYVNGHGPFTFLIDTGTTANHLDVKLAERIGLKPAFRRQLITSVGAAYVPGVDGVEISLDSVRATSQRILFAGNDVIRQFAPGVQGILGQAFLSNFDFRLDMRGKQIEFGTQASQASGIRAPLRTTESRPTVSTNLGALMLDSGTGWVTLFGVEGSNPGGEMTTLAGTLRLGTVSRKLTIQGHTFWTGEALAVPHPAEGGAEGLLPLSVFKTVYVSNSAGFVSFE